MAPVARQYEDDGCQLVRCLRGVISPAAQHAARRGVDDPATQDCPDWLQPELEGGRHPEVAAAPAQRPEQVRVSSALACSKRPSAVASPPTAGCRSPARTYQPSNRSRRRASGRRGPPRRCRLPRWPAHGRSPSRHMPPGQSWPSPGDAARGVNAQPLHTSQIDHQAAVDRAMAGDAMAAAAHCQREALLAGED